MKKLADGKKIINITFLHMHFFVSVIDKENLLIYDSIKGYLTENEIINASNMDNKIKIKKVTFCATPQQDENPKVHCGFFSLFSFLCLMNNVEPAIFHLAGGIKSFRRHCVLQFVHQLEEQDCNQSFLDWIATHKTMIGPIYHVDE